MAGNPWLRVPLADYEGHMAHVGQAALLDRLLGDAIARLQPRSLAVLGAAGGNGFGHLVGPLVTRTVAVDLNPDYLRELERRYAGRVQSLETVCADIADPELRIDPVDYVHATLVFEYADAAAALANIGRWVMRGGSLGVLLQLPGSATVSPSPFARVAELAPAMHLKDEDEFVGLAHAAGFKESGRQAIEMPGGKRFVWRDFRFGRVSQKR